MIQLHNISVNLGGHDIFKDLSWTIDPQKRIGLVGPNGAGKSTLMRLLTGELPPDAGTITRTGGVRAGYLPQEVVLPEGLTALEAASEMPPRLLEVENRLRQVEERLADPAVYNDERKLTRTLEQQETVLLEYERLGVAQQETRVQRLLNQLGFTEDDFTLPAETLSGGQKKMIALVRLATAMPDLLLLDEPDNHLDLEAKRHLETFIRGYPGTVVLISHDRYLLDETVTDIVELERGRLTAYAGNYSRYAGERELAKMRQQQAYVTQQKQIAQIEDAIKRFEEWAARTEDPRHFRQARSRRKMLERMEERGEIVEQVRERRLMDLQINGHRGSNKALNLQGVTMAFDDDILFMDLDLLVRHGERVGLIGPNGAGKSVLFQLILGEMLPIEGVIQTGPSTKIGYYAQEHQTLDAFSDRTPVALVQDVANIGEGDAVGRLLKFEFAYEQVRQPVRTLSGGERSRLQLLRLMLQQPNLLLLDEPTNNLDIPSVEVLEETLTEFDGAVLTISHDRYFLDRVVDRVVELKDGDLTGYLGGYSAYLASK